MTCIHRLVYGMAFHVINFDVYFSPPQHAHNTYVFCIPQENGFEFDLAPFACRSVEISFAVATHEMNVSSYSPSTAVELSSGSGKQS